jgi:formylglycine-generating enzyme required for sulfatase activity
VKVLSPDLITSHTTLERFRREAATIAQLSHPHIVPLHFVGQKDDLVYLAMEAIDGGSLADRLERERQLPIDDAARILGEVASALAHAHKRGVVHRDVKPQNVLLDSESGRALLTDFGIARTTDGGPLTASGMVVGTVAYLSPEQVSGDPADHRSDIYALGVMAYEMLAGRAPFTGATPTAVMMKRLAGPPEPLRAIRRDVPPALASLVDACLTAEPSERVQSAADVARGASGLSGASAGRVAGAQGYPTNRTSLVRHRIIGLIVAAVVAVGIGAYVFAANSTTGPIPGVASRPPLVDSGMVLIAAGSYPIGADTGAEVIRPRRSVTLRAFGIDGHEVTVAEYQRYVDARGVEPPWMTRPADDLPVVGVRHAEAVSFCAWRHPDGGRLPTDDEWEAAARGLEGRDYPWGHVWDSAAANTGARKTGPSPPGSYPRGRSPEGAYDLIGNVWEWTATPYRGFADTSSRRTGTYYAIRGGAYNAFDRVSTALFKSGAAAVTDRSNLAATGFRCAMSARDRIR